MGAVRRAHRVPASTQSALRPGRYGLLLAKTGNIAAQTEYLANGTYLALEERGNKIMGQPAELVWLDEPSPQAATQNMTGILQPNAGKIVFDGHDITAMPVHNRIRLGVSRSFQILSVFRNLTAFENVRVAVQARDKRAGGLWRDAYDYEDLNART